MSDKEPPTTYWAFWHEASGSGGHRRGPFPHREDAVRHIEEDLRLWAAQLEHGTGDAGEWGWDTAHQVWTLYRGGILDWLPLGYYVIEEVATEARTDDDTPPVEVAALRAVSRVDAMVRSKRFDLFFQRSGLPRLALAMRTTMNDATHALRNYLAVWDKSDDREYLRSWDAWLEEHDGVMTHVWNWNKQTASWDPARNEKLGTNIIEEDTDIV